MLDQQKISLGRVRQAYALNENEIEKIIQALWPDAVFPLDLWSKADEKFWRGLISRNASLYNTINMQLPKVDVLDAFYTHIHTRRVATFFNEIIFIIPSIEVKAGFNFILDEAFDKSEHVFFEERKMLFDKLFCIEKAHRHGNSYLTHDATNEEFIAELEEKKISIPPNSRFFIDDIICDTIVVEKAAAIRHLSVCGFPLLNEVKGITHSLVGSILNPQAQEPVAPETTAPPVELAAEVPPQTPRDSISVPRSLWEGKTRESIVTAMRAAGFDDAVVIAHIIFFKRKIKGKRAVGKLLGPPNRSDFLYDKKGREFYEKAKLIIVIDKDES